MSAPAVDAPAGVDRFVARQPILDTGKRTVAYELLFRSGTDNFFSFADGDQASSDLIHSSLLDFGLDRLTGGKKAFINVTRGILLQGLIAAVPARGVVLEILETVTPDNDVIAACSHLKQLGYELALDDFVAHPDIEPLVDLADIIKIDFLTTTGEQRERISKHLRSRSIQLLAEKVETEDEFLDAQRLGYTWFQGYFFCRPEVLTTKSIPGSKLNHLKFLRDLNRPDLDVDSLTATIKRDVSLSIKLLRYINSWVVALPYQVTSIKRAILLLGHEQLRRWGSLVAIATMCRDKPAELLVLCLVRARFCELVGPVAGLGHAQSELFLTGLLSGVEALVGRPLPELLAEIAVADQVKAALLGRPSPLAPVYRLALAYEKADWEAVSALLRELNVPEGQVADSYQRSIAWSSEVLFIDRS